MTFGETRPIMANAHSTTIMGIDQAIRHTGVARWRDGRLSTMTVHSDPRAPIEERMRWICGHIWPLVTRRTFVVLEEPFVTSNGKTSMALAGLYYVLRYGLHARGVPFAVIGNSRLKSFATGHGGAAKHAMVQHAVATFGPGAGLAMGAWVPSVPVTDVDAASHEADALWAMTSGLYHTWAHGWLDKGTYPAMQPGLSDKQVAVYEKAAVEWPQLEWEAQQ